jgi:MFS family permease
VRDLLANRRLMIFWSGQAVSRLGDGMAPIAAAALALRYYGTGGLGAVLAAEALGLGFTLLAGGVIADRFSRTAVMAVADLLRLGGALALLVCFGRAPLPVICAIAAGVGIGTALFVPAFGAALAQLLEPDQLRRANALQGIVNRASMTLGAALAGVLVATVGPRWTYAIDAATFAVSIATLLVVRLPRLAGGARGVGLPGAVRDAREGLRAVLAQPWAAVVMAQGTVQVVIGFAPVQVLLPVVAIDRYGSGAYGALAAAQGVGSMLGGVVALRRKPRREGVTAMHGVALFAPVCACLAVPVPLWLFLICQAVAWAGIAVFLAIWFASLQRQFARTVHGRVLALEGLVTIALQPVGLALAPLAAQRFGIPAVGLFTAVVIVVSSYAVLAVPGVVHFAPPRPSEPEASVPGSAVHTDLS